MNLTFRPIDSSERLPLLSASVYRNLEDRQSFFNGRNRSFVFEHHPGKAFARVREFTKLAILFRRPRAVDVSRIRYHFTTRSPLFLGQPLGRDEHVFGVDASTSR